MRCKQQTISFYPAALFVGAGILSSVAMAAEANTADAIKSIVVPEPKPSILFINVDDWNDWNEVLQGHPQAITPNIKRLAERGVVFGNAICPSPTCLPSRTALFSGVHPARSGNIVNDNGIHPWRSYVPDAVTLPRHLSGQGWQTIGIAKNFHGGDAPEENAAALQKAIDWASPRGGALFVEPSDEPYPVAGGVILRANVSLIGVHGPVGRGTRHPDKPQPVGSVLAIVDEDHPFLTVETPNAIIQALACIDKAEAAYSLTTGGDKK